MTVIHKFPGVESRGKTRDRPSATSYVQLGTRQSQQPVLKRVVAANVAQERLRAQYEQLAAIRRQPGQPGPPPVADLRRFERYSIEAEIEGDSFKIRYWLPVAEATVLRQLVGSSRRAIVKHGSLYFLRQLREPAKQFHRKLSGENSLGMVELTFEGTLDSVPQDEEFFAAYKRQLERCEAYIDTSREEAPEDEKTYFFSVTDGSLLTT